MKRKKSVIKGNDSRFFSVKKKTRTSLLPDKINMIFSSCLISARENLPQLESCLRNYIIIYHINKILQLILFLFQ